VANSEGRTAVSALRRSEIGEVSLALQRLLLQDRRPPCYQAFAMLLRHRVKEFGVPNAARKAGCLSYAVRYPVGVPDVSCRYVSREAVRLAGLELAIESSD